MGPFTFDVAKHSADDLQRMANVGFCRTSVAILAAVDYCGVSRDRIVALSVPWGSVTVLVAGADTDTIERLRTHAEPNLPVAISVEWAVGPGEPQPQKRRGGGFEFL